MSEKRNKILKNNTPVSPYSKKQFFLTIILWLLFGVALWGFLTFSAIELLIFVVFCELIRRLAIYWGKKFDVIMFPRSFVAWLKQTRLFQVFAMALKQQWSAAWIVFSVIPACFFWVAIHDYREPILDLDQMEVIDAYVEKIKEGRPGRFSSNKDYLYLRDKNNLPKKGWSFFGQKQFKELEKIKKNKETVRVWYQLNHGDPEMNIWEIRHGDHVIQKYNKSRVTKTRGMKHKMALYLFAYFIFTIGFIYFFYAKKLRR